LIAFCLRKTRNSTINNIARAKTPPITPAIIGTIEEEVEGCSMSAEDPVTVSLPVEVLLVVTLSVVEFDVVELELVEAELVESEELEVTTTIPDVIDVELVVDVVALEVAAAIVLEKL
jgi:hypothetical protein